MAQKKNSKPIPVESTKHKDKRVNIPTEELRNFVREDELAPKTMLYPRDPSLDPQLVWKGKDEQDAEDLAVPTVPVYIQEKIYPQALIENLRETSKVGDPGQGNLLVEGDNLQALLPYYAGQVKCVFLLVGAEDYAEKLLAV